MNSDWMWTLHGFSSFAFVLGVVLSGVNAHGKRPRQNEGFGIWVEQVLEDKAGCVRTGLARSVLLRAQE